MRLTQYGFSRNLIFADCSKICRENSGFIKIWQEKGYFIRRRMYIPANISQNCGRNRHILPSMCVCVCARVCFFYVAAHENTEDVQNAVFRIDLNSGYGTRHNVTLYVHYVSSFPLWLDVPFGINTFKPEGHRKIQNNQLVPRSKHSVSVIKTNQLMLYSLNNRCLFADPHKTCKHIVCAERRILEC
jgi:hypothetical protein